MMYFNEESPIAKITSVIIWLTGVIVAIAVGFGLIARTLTIPWANNLWGIPVIAGWIVVILTIVFVILVIIDRF